jgi:hypothetical protein
MTVTELDVKKARRVAHKGTKVVEHNRVAIANVRRVEAELDHAIAKSDIKTAHYRRVLKRAGVLK